MTDVVDSDADEATGSGARRQQQGQEARPAGRSRGQGLAEWFGILATALVAAFLINTYVVQTFWIPSGSMEQTLLVGDRLLVNKLAYRTGDIHRGDIVVFRRPPNEPDKSIDDLIKRVIGLPGDTLETRDGAVYINGTALSETYLRPGERTWARSGYQGGDVPPTVVPAGEYWVMGDHRTNSQDSRVFGPIDKDLVVGKATFRIWPLGRFGTLD